MPPTFQLGTVPYLNARPLVEGLDAREDVELLRDVPARLVTRLRAGALDAALVSAVELFRTPCPRWIAGPGVTGRGAVRSIRLYLRTAPARVRTVALDTSSRTAATLAVVALQEFLGARLERRTLAPPDTPLEAIEADAILRIGDPALRTPPGDLQLVDLGELWTARTGLPFVFAAWLVPPDGERPEHLERAAARLSELLLAARVAGLARLPDIAREHAGEAGLSPEQACEYLTEHIGFAIGPEELAGLSLFGRLAHRHGLVDRAEVPAPLA